MSSRRMRSLELMGTHNQAQEGDEDELLPSTIKPKSTKRDKKLLRDPSEAIMNEKEAKPSPQLGRDSRAKEKTPKQSKKPSRVQQNPSEIEEDDVDAILAHYRQSAPQTEHSTETVEPPQALTIDAYFLDADMEMKRQLAGLGNNKPTSHKKRAGNIFVTPASEWPPIDSDQLVATESKERKGEFTLTPSSLYKEATAAYEFAVATMDNHALQMNLRKHPYHIQTLFQLSNILGLTGSVNEARGLLNMAMYALGHIPRFSSFSWLRPTNRSLPYNEKTQIVFQVIAEYVHCLIRQGCHRTAAEYAKLLYTLDKSDPMRILLVIDFCYIRSGCPQAFLDVRESITMRLFTLEFSEALCLFLVGNVEKATESLRVAHTRYPAVLPVLFDEANSSSVVPRDHSPMHPLVERLAPCYEARMREVWGHKPEARSWGVRVMQQGPLLSSVAVVTEFGAELDVYDGVTVDEIMGQRALIPGDVLREAQEQGGPGDPQQGNQVQLPFAQDTWARMQEVFGPPPDGLSGPEVVQYYEALLAETEEHLGADQHPLMLFLRSLLPWNSVERMALDNEEARRQNRHEGS